MSIITNDCFSGVLSAAMQSYGVGGRKLEEILHDQGVEDISYKRISEYVNGHHTPSLEKAKILFKTLEYPIDEEELKILLARNREMVKEEEEYTNSNARELRVFLRLKLKKLLPDETVEKTELLLRQRVSELCGDENKLSAYVQSLIAKDLNEYIINKEDLK